MIYTTGDTSVSQILSDLDHLYPKHINELRQATMATAIVSKEPDNYYYCDGVDDQVQINQALTDVAAAGGGMVFIKSSSTPYNVSSAVLMPAGYYIHLCGENRASTIIKLANGANCNVIEAGVPASPADFTKITGLSVNGNRANQTDLVGDGLQCGIFTHSQNYVVIRDVDISQCISVGYYGHDWSSFIDSMLVSNCSGQGISTDASQYVTISNCRVVYCGSEANPVSGFYIVGGAAPFDASNVSVIGCHTYRCYGPGFTAINASNVSFIGCQSLEDGKSAGVEFGTTNPAFWIRSSQRVSVIGCHGRLSSKAGIWIDESNRCIVKGNQLINNGGVAEAATSAGVLIYNGLRNNIEGNICYDDQTPKIQAYGVRETGTTDYSLINSNDVAGNLSGTIVTVGGSSQANHNMVA